MSDPVVTKYLACTQFEPSTGECTASVWVDPPAVIPPLTAEQGFVIASSIGVVWAATVAVVLPRYGARLKS